jgi:hypothetical protein
MRKNFVLMIIALITLTGCLPSYYTGIDFIRNIQKTNPRDRYFKWDDVVYFSELTAQSIIYIGKNGVLDADKADNIEEYKSLIDYWNLEEKDNYGYETPSIFLANEYNVNMSAGFQALDQTSTLQVDMPMMKLFSLKSIVDSNFVIKMRKTNENQMDIPVLEPENLNSFCEKFSQHYPDATKVILSGFMMITTNALTYSVSYNTQDEKHAGTILVSKTIIDLKNKEIAGYDLNQTPIFYSYFETIKTGLKKGFTLDGSRLREYF